MPFFEYDNKRIFYRDEGEGEVILLLPGNTASSAVHRSEIEFFSRSYRVICPDYLGYGQSDRVDRLPLDFWWDSAKMCTELLKSLKVSNVISIGTSGGGVVALDTAIISPDIVKCIVADSIPGEFPNRDQLMEEVKNRNLLSEDLIRFWEYAHGPDWAKVVQLDSKFLLEMAESHKSVFNERLHEINCPVLLTASLSDNDIPNIETGICSVARKITDSKIVLFPQGEHPLMWSQLCKFRNEVLNFLANVN